jgi:predicted deacetylase
MASVVISLHDVSPATFDESRRWLQLVERHGLVATLLVVPGRWRGSAPADSVEFVEWLKAAASRGHELSLHGWEHRSVSRSLSRSAHRSGLHRLIGRVLARGCEEFWMLGYDEAHRRVEQGLVALRECGVRTRGFTPPGWLSSPESRAALRDLDVDYTTSQFTVRDLVSRKKMPMFAFSQRPGSSVVDVAAWLNERSIETCVRRRWSFRLALHPDDLRHASIVTSVNRSMRLMARADLTSVTYGRLIDDQRSMRAGAVRLPTQWSTQ